MESLSDRVPPNNVEAERAVIGAMLLDKEAVAKVLEILTYHHFYVPNHQIMFKVIWDVFNLNQPIDLVTVSDSLKSSGLLEDIGGYMYLLDLSESVPTTANVEQYARIVEEKFIRRELIKISNEISDMCYESSDDISKLLDTAEKKIFNVGQKRFTRDLVHIKELLVDNFENISNDYPDDAQVNSVKTGISTGISSLDEITNGLNPSDLIIIAARPAMGKTSFCLNLATNIAIKERYPVAIFSLEMSKEQITQRIVCSEAEISNYHFRVGNVPRELWSSITDAVGKLYNAPIYIDDSSSLTPIEIRSKVRRLKAEHKKLGAVIIDYLQLMDVENSENRVQEIAKITRSLKRLARELDVPVIALSQLSRMVEQRQNKRPQLSDLRESGCLTGDTLIIDSKTGLRKQIKDLVGQSFETLAINNEYKIKSHSVPKVFYSGKKMVYELKTKTGRKIKASGNHPFLKLEGWERLNHLKTGDKIAVARKIEIDESSNPMSDDEIILLAHLLGNGSRLPKDPPVTNPYKNLRLGLGAPYDKLVPDALFECNKAKISLFLRHIWATGGNISWQISKNRKPSVNIYYETPSQKLAEQVHHLLLRCNIISTVSTVKSKQGYWDIYQILIQESNNQTVFLKTIGSFGEKCKNTDMILKALDETHDNINYDVIPKEALVQNIQQDKEKIETSLREFSKNLEMSYSGSTILKYAISVVTMSQTSTFLPDKNLENLSESDILWDEIVSVTELGIEDVYDATVNLVHNFVANDFIVHNSIEQDADIVMFIYRDEYYNPDSDKKKIAELIIAKHRNGPVGTVELFFDAGLTKFSGLEK